MPKHTVKKCNMAAFIFLPQKTKGYFYKAKFCICAILHFRRKIGEKLEQIMSFFLLKKCIYMLSFNIYKAGFPGIKVWNILLNFTHVCR